MLASQAAQLSGAPYSGHPRSAVTYRIPSTRATVVVQALFKRGNDKKEQPKKKKQPEKPATVKDQLAKDREYA